MIHIMNTGLMAGVPRAVGVVAPAPVSLGHGDWELRAAPD